jgi:acetyl esterase
MDYERAKWALCALFMAVSGSPAAAQQVNLPAEVGAAITTMGPKLDSDLIEKTRALMQPLQASRTGLSASNDLAYGSDALQKLDLYAPSGSPTRPVPIIVFVHGGGFATGDKRDGGSIAAYFSRHSMLGIAINYRLVPAATWPDQSLDLGDAMAWLKANAGRYGADPSRIIVIGQSSGAAVVASYVLDQSIKTVRDGVVGAVLLSGVYGYVPFPPGAAALQYYGDDLNKATARQPRSHINESKLPFFIVTAEFDPPRFGAESHELAAAICARDGKCPPFLWLSGHNHISEFLSVDTKDDRLGQTVLEFVRSVVK